MGKFKQKIKIAAFFRIHIRWIRKFEFRRRKNW